MGAPCWPQKNSSLSREEVHLRRWFERLQFFAFGAMAGGLTNVSVGREFGFLEVAQDSFGAFDDGFRNTGQSRDLDAVAFVRAAFDNFAQENDLIIPFTDGDIEVANTRQASGEFSKFVIVRGEEGFRANLIV